MIYKFEFEKYSGVSIDSFTESAIKKFVENTKAGIPPASAKYDGMEIRNNGDGVILVKNGRTIIPQERKDAVLQALYDDPATGLKGADQLWQVAKEKYIGINSKDVRRFVQSQQTEQTQYPVVRAKVNRPIIKSASNEQWHYDLVDLSEFGGWNNNVKYLLTVINAFSKHAWVFPLKNKEEEGVVEPLLTLFTECKLLVLVTENGSEFISRRVNSVLDDNKVRHIYTKANSPQSNAQVERFNKTTKTKIYKIHATL